MSEFNFQAIGTAWSILIDEAVLLPKDQQDLLARVGEFEKRFSRFLPDSEVNQFRAAPKGKYEISKEFAKMLTVADTLRTLTRGIYDPATAVLLEHTGYNPEYRLTADEEKIKEYILPKWSLHHQALSLEGPTAFDLGGIGKGYCIDLVASFLKERGYQYFLVEAGGDMYGTEKQNGHGYTIALEWPGKPGIAYGTVELRHMGLAVSDSFRRRWQNWHHIIDPLSKKPIEKILGCTALAKSAFAADCMTSGLFLSDSEHYRDIAKKFEAEFVVFRRDSTVQISENWPGEFFK